MKRRLYFLAHDIADAKLVFNQLLLARVNVHHIHFLSKNEADLGDLPAATNFQRYDIRGSAAKGFILGAIIGIFGGIIGHGVFNVAIGGAMIATTIIGALLGGWFASMIGMMVPNQELKKFKKDIEDGQVLIIVDVPFNKVKHTEDLVLNSVPQVKFCGLDPTVPSFP